MQNLSKKRVALLLICCSLCSIPVFAQNKTMTKKVPSSGGTSLSVDQSKMLCKAWQIDSISQFDLVTKPLAKQVNDAVTFSADGSVSIIQDGVSSTGTWTYASGGINIATKTGNKLSFKLSTLSDNRLILEYQYPAPDLSRIKYMYSPKK